jgi:hypothetical protein
MRRTEWALVAAGLPVQRMRRCLGNRPSWQWLSEGAEPIRQII